MERLERLREAGVSIWLDTLSRDLLETGEFERLVRDFSVSGATSNPTIFAKAITGSDRYDDELRRAVGGGVHDPRELFFELALEDIRRAAEVLRPVHERDVMPRAGEVRADRPADRARTPDQEFHGVREEYSVGE